MCETFLHFVLLYQHNVTLSPGLFDCSPFSGIYAACTFDVIFHNIADIFQIWLASYEKRSISANQHRRKIESNKFAHQLAEGSYKLGMLTIAPLKVDISMWYWLALE